MADDWMEHAACRGSLNHLIPERLMKTRRDRIPAAFKAQVEAARLVCASCPVLEACRIWCVDSADDPVPHHIAAGLTPQERSKVRRQAYNAGLRGAIARKHGVWPSCRDCTCSRCLERVDRQRRLRQEQTQRYKDKWRTGGRAIAHGTYTGYKQHQLADLPYCDACRLAYNAYQRQYRISARARGLISV